MEYKVVETFVSINGEGQWAGELALFIRLAGCNLNCNYCDTTWANEPSVAYKSMTKEAIASRVREAGVRHVTITGGEPLIQAGIGELLEHLGTIPDIQVEIETNGSVDIEPFVNLKVRPSFTLDYKLPGSGMNTFMKVENYRFLTLKDTVKFVVSDKQDLEVAGNVIETYGLQGICGIYLSPVFGRIEPAEIVEYMVEHRLNQVHVQLQLHKFIWDPQQRGV
ncbi:MAG: putative 7-carboxy-7-deazaguanine synthase QueE [Lachnospiraceae bacterium]|nr:putative 7-carboxy-7-deazaguanine synthase QueE [Lachnospiraceae bacterium]